MGLDKHSFLKLSVELCYILFKGEDNAVEMKNDFVEKLSFLQDTTEIVVHSRVYCFSLR